MASEALEQAKALLEKMKAADWEAREALKDELAAMATPESGVPAFLESVLKELPLEVRWDVQEILEALAPPPVEEPEEEEEEELDDPNAPLRMSDLDEVYADPRGLALYVDKRTRTRWFAQQIDPRTGQPVMMEVPPDQVDQIKMQLQGSPYWRIGAGVQNG